MAKKHGWHEFPTTSKPPNFDFHDVAGSRYCKRLLPPLCVLTPLHPSFLASLREAFLCVFLLLYLLSLFFCPRVLGVFASLREAFLLSS
jgi:hypothetical protein